MLCFSSSLLVGLKWISSSSENVLFRLHFYILKKEKKRTIQQRIEWINTQTDKPGRKKTFSWHCLQLLLIMKMIYGSTKTHWFLFQHELQQVISFFVDCYASVRSVLLSYQLFMALLVLSDVKQWVGGGRGEEYQIQIWWVMAGTVGSGHQCLCVVLIKTAIYALPVFMGLAIVAVPIQARHHLCLDKLGGRRILLTLPFLLPHLSHSIGPSCQLKAKPR